MRTNGFSFYCKSILCGLSSKTSEGSTAGALSFGSCLIRGLLGPVWNHHIFPSHAPCDATSPRESRPRGGPLDRLHAHEQYPSHAEVKSAGRARQSHGWRYNLPAALPSDLALG